MTFDLIADSAAQDFDLPLATKHLLSMIYKKVAEHRDAIGYPEGSSESPYFMVSNDLSLKFAMCLKLMLDAKVEATLPSSEAASNSSPRGSSS